MENGTGVLVEGIYPATVVAERPDLGGIVVAMTGENGTMIGEQFLVSEDMKVI